MPPRPRRTSRTFSRRPRRRFEWVDSQSNVAAQAVGNYSALDLLQAYDALPGASTVGATVVRIHARLWITSAVVVGDGISWSFIVAPNINATASLAIASARALTPINQPMADWMMYQKFNAHPQYDFHGGTSANLEMDIRSKRRLKELDDTLLMIVENVDASAAISYSWHVRTLLALP